MKTQIYLNGEFVSEEEAKVSIWDIGFMYSAVFMEAARTFNHRIYRLDDHLARLDDSMRYAGIEPLVSQAEMGDIVEKTSYDQIYDEHAFYFSVASISPVSARGVAKSFASSI